MRRLGVWQWKGRTWVVLAATMALCGTTGLAVLWGRGDPPPQTLAAPAQKTQPSTPAPAPTPPAVSSAYTEGVVAYIYGSTPVTRAQFGEYLIARVGAEKLEPFVNRTIIERACQARNITVTADEVTADLTESLKSVPGDKKQFLDNLLKQKQLTLKEWKDDVVRPKLLLGKYCRERVRFTEEDVKKAFDSFYGEKVLCQLIIWTPDEVAKHRPTDVYRTICSSAEEFDREARGQYDKKLASAAGQLKPFGHYSQENEEMEKLAFQLHDGEVSQVLSLFPNQPPEKCGAYVIRRLKLIPPDPTKKLEDVRATLEREIFEYKLKTEIPKVMDELYKDAKPELIKLEQVEGEKALPPGPPSQVVATIHGNVALTREQFGEYLIDRYGADRLELFVNRLIVERVCKDKGIEVSEDEVETALKQYIDQFAGGDKKVLVNRMLRPNKTSLYELKHDILWPKLMLTKYCRDRVQVEDQELRQAYEAHYGDKVRVRMIMFPKEMESTVRRTMYARLRDDDAEFVRQAKQQVVTDLASRAGETVLAHHTTGHDEVEKTAFQLAKGDISPVFSLPEGVVVFKVLDHMPADKGKKLEDVRGELEKEVREAKLRERVIPLVYEELRKQANPILLLKKSLTEEELKREVVRELNTPDTGLAPPPKKGN
jgi:parvulin-like peptidyl-prolyl isomerase